MQSDAHFQMIYISDHLSISQPQELKRDFGAQTDQHSRSLERREDFAKISSDKSSPWALKHGVQHVQHLDLKKGQRRRLTTPSVSNGLLQVLQFSIRYNFSFILQLPSHSTRTILLHHKIMLHLTVFTKHLPFILQGRNALGFAVVLCNISGQQPCQDCKFHRWGNQAPVKTESCALSKCTW